MAYHLHSTLVRSNTNHMKKITLLFIAAILTLACSDDDRYSTITIDGTWKLTNIKLGIPGSDLNGDGKISANFVEESPCLGNSVLSFTDATTAVFTMGDSGDGPSRVITTKNDPVICAMKAPETVSFIVNPNSVEFTYISTIASPGTQLKRTFIRANNKLIAKMSIQDTEMYIPGSGEYGNTNFYTDATFEFTKQ